MDFLILGGLVLLAVGLGIYFLIKGLLVPHKLDSIKAMMEAGKYKEAIEALNSFLKKDERNPLAHLYLAEAYFYSDSYEMAMVEYKQVLTIGKFAKSATERIIRHRLAEIYTKFGQMEEAQKEYVVLTQLEPENFDNLYQIANVFYDRGMKEQAQAYLNKVLKLSHNHSPTFFLLGKILYETNKGQEALNSFTNCLKINPHNAESHYYVGRILKSMGNYGKAIAEFEQAEKAKENPMKVKAIFQKGLSKFEMGDLDGSIADFERSLKYSNEENNVTLAVRYTLGVSYERQRRLLEAVEQWEKVAALRPNFQDIQVKLAQYEDLRIDDKLKDLLTATPTTFEFICQKMVGAMGYEVVNSEVFGDDNVVIEGVERSTKWRNVRGGKVLVTVSRSNNDVQESEIATMIERMKTVHGTRVIIITTGKFTPGALRYAENRPVHLYDRQKLSALMKEVN